MTIQFACPHCGKQTVVADQYAGQSGPCVNCGEKVTIPAGPAPGAVRLGWGLSTLMAAAGVTVMAFLVCAGLGVALIIPSVNSGRLASKRVQSMNNLKQLGLALHNYHDVNGCFPPAVVHDANGQPLYSGRVLLLPYLEQDGVYRRFDKTRAWNSPENMPLSKTAIPTFCDPMKDQQNVPYRSDYVFVTGPQTIFEANQRVQIQGITDGTSNTVMMIETAQGPGSWAEPAEWDVTAALPPGNHQRVRLLLYADGSVRPVDHATAQQFIRAITSRNGGETVTF